MRSSRCVTRYLRSTRNVRSSLWETRTLHHVTLRYIAWVTWMTAERETRTLHRVTLRYIAWVTWMTAERETRTLHRVTLRYIAWGHLDDGRERKAENEGPRDGEALRCVTVGKGSQR